MRVRADRLRARGDSKDYERVDEWFIEAAPTDESRQRSHDSGGFPNSSEKYRKDLEERVERFRAFDALPRLAWLEPSDARLHQHRHSTQQRGGA